MKCARADTFVTKLSRRHMICGSHYQEAVSDESDRKEDAMENHSKYHSSDIPDQENRDEEDDQNGGSERNKSSIFKIEKHKSTDSIKEKEKMEED